MGKGEDYVDYLLVFSRLFCLHPFMPVILKKSDRQGKGPCFITRLLLLMLRSLMFFSLTDYSPDGASIVLLPAGSQKTGKSSLSNEIFCTQEYRTISFLSGFEWGKQW